MSLVGPARYVRYERSRTLIYISQKLTDDSGWPFKPGEQLVARIEPRAKRLVIEKVPSATASKK